MAERGLADDSGLGSKALTGALSVAGIALGVLWALHANAGASTEDPRSSSVVALGPTPVEVALVDGDGRPFTTAELRGHWSIVYLGYTRCPDVCPTTLAVLGRAASGLDASLVFVSVDPERDSPADVAAYAARFDPRIRGVGGTPEATRAFAAALGGGVERDGDAVDHSTSLFVVDPRARVVGAILRPSSPGRVARDFETLR